MGEDPVIERLARIEDRLTNVENDVTLLKNDVAWLKRLYRSLVYGSS